MPSPFLCFGGQNNSIKNAGYISLGVYPVSFFIIVDNFYLTMCKDYDKIKSR